MKDFHYLVYKLNSVFLHNILHFVEVLQSTNTENNIQSMPRDHNFQRSVPARYSVSYNDGPELAEAHLKQLSNPEYGLAQLHRFKLVGHI